MLKRNKTIIGIALVALVCVGIGTNYYFKYLKKTKINEYVLAGVNAMNAKDYTQCKTDMNNALKIDKNNVTAKEIISCINSYDSLKSDVSSKNITKGEEDIKTLPNFYSKYSIKNDLDNLKNKIISEEKNETAIKNSIKTALSLENNKHYEDAKKVLSNINKNNETSQELDEVKKINTRLQNEITTAEKAQVIKVIDSVSKSKPNNNSSKNTHDTFHTTVYNLKETQQKETPQKETAPKETITENVVYENPNLGLKMTFPSSWKDKYYIVNNSNGGITVFLKLKSSPFQDEGELFEIDNYNTVKDMANMIDSIPSSQRFVTAKGVKYLIGGPTDVDIDPNNPQAKEFMNMSGNASIVTNTISPM